MVVAILAALVVAAMVAVPGLVSGGADDGPAPGGTSAGSNGAGSGATQDQGWEALVRRDPEDPMARGEVDAPVVLIAYSEFQCPFCGRFARETEPVLVEKYVEEGILRIEWRDFPYLGAESTVAAKGGRAAAAQGAFWDFHEALYADQPSPNSGTITEDFLADIAEDIGLDVDQFREDLGSDTVADAVATDFSEGQSIGVTGTPTFVINGQPIVGAQPTEVFEQAVEQAADEAS
jgi:protein-disulfide isomerase